MYGLLVRVMCMFDLYRGTFVPHISYTLELQSLFSPMQAD